MTIDIRADLEKLYKSIMAMATGEQVQSIGHKGRSAAYNNARLTEMCDLYRKMWRAEYELPELPADLGTSNASRGCLNVRLIG